MAWPALFGRAFGLEFAIDDLSDPQRSDYGLEADPGEDGKLPLSLSIFTHKPAEKAIRSAIQKAVADIIRLIPPEYFRN